MLINAPRPHSLVVDGVKEAKMGTRRGEWREGSDKMGSSGEIGGFRGGMGGK